MNALLESIWVFLNAWLAVAFLWKSCRDKEICLITRAIRHRVLKWALVWLSYYFRRGRLPVFMVITFFARGQSTIGQMTAKNEMWASEVCFTCLTWLYRLFVRTLISRTNAYAGCGRPTLNFIERFWLGSVRLAFKLNSKCSQMNYMCCLFDPNF